MFNLLASNASSYVMIIALVAVIVVFMVINTRSAKKRQQEQQNMLDAIRPGNKVKTIGGVCGVVVEVNAEDNTFVLETGTESSGKSYIKFDKQAVFQTDAVVEKKTPVKEEKTAEEKTDEASAEQAAQAEDETPETTENND